MLVKMHKYIFGFLLLMYMENASDQRKIVIECTTNCECDMKENLRRAICENGKMLNLLGNVPNHTEVLEFSYNYVSELKNAELYNSGLSSLKLANFSHNRIKEIHIYCFDKMTQLQTLDLSHNALQYLLPEWFWPLPSLKELYMNNNNLGQLESRPLLSSMTLQILNLAYCQIPHIEDDALTEMPNLEKLDITGNYLVELSSDVIKPCKKLIDIKMEHNSIECNNVGMLFTAYCVKNNVHIDNNFCKVSENIKVEDDKNDKLVLTKRKDDVKSVWVYDVKEMEEVKNNHTVICEKTFIIEVLEMSPTLSIIILITLGFLAGLIIGCSCNIKPKKATQSKINKSNIASSGHLGTERLMEHIYDNTQSTPIAMKRQINDMY